MKAILINPDTKEVTQVETTGQLKDIYRLLNCHMIEAPITYANRDVLYCNEEAWLEFNEDAPQAGWMFNGFEYGILGKSMIIGMDDEGNEADHKTNINVIINQIHWLSTGYMVRQGEAMGLV
jgi:hypothetical protein